MRGIFQPQSAEKDGKDAKDGKDGKDAKSAKDGKAAKPAAKPAPLPLKPSGDLAPAKGTK